MYYIGKSGNILKSGAIFIKGYNSSKLMVGLNIFYSEEKDCALHTTRQCPLQRKYLQKNLVTHTHMHTHTSKNKMFDNTKRNNN